MTDLDIVALLSVYEAAEQAGVSASTIKRAVYADQLGHYRIGKRILIHPDQLARWIDDHRTGS